MTRSRNMMVVALSLVGASIFPVSHSAFGADEDPNAPLIEMITELLHDADRDMRALGLQQVRDEVPGEAATQKFTELLPTLTPDAQAGLLEALGDRGDTTALPTVLEALQGDQPVVRVAALHALGDLGGEDEVPVLADKAATGSVEEQRAARQSLGQLHGDNINSAIEALLKEGPDQHRVALLGVLASRDATQCLPVVLQLARESAAPVRLAALQAIRYLASDENVANVVDLLKGAADDTQRRAAKLALLTICSRARQACVAPIVAGMTDADPAAQVVLLEALARAGGEEALATIADYLKDDDESVRDEAVRMLSRWPTTDAVPHLRQLAQSDNLRHQVLAIRGLVRLGQPRGDQPGDVELLVEAMKLARRPQEKRLVLGALGCLPNATSLAQTAAALQDSEVADEAGLAAVLIAENMPDDEQADRQAVMQQVVKTTTSDAIRERAQQVLGN